METIRIVPLTGTSVCVTAEDGEKVHSVLRDALAQEKEVSLSFEGVEDLTSLFLNAAVGQLYKEFSKEEIKARLSVVDMTQDDLVTLKRSVERAKEYFRNPERFHEATLEALGDDND